jgi:MFS family permease
MGERILLIEPYEDLVNSIGSALEELGYRYDVVTDADINERDLLDKPYACVLINIDQNSDAWRTSGLRFAETASKLHLPVVVIADYKLSAATATANGWKTGWGQAYGRRGIAIWSVATALTALTGGFVSILAARLAMGASEATTFPACGRVIRDWFPEGEHEFVTRLFNGGSTAGPALGAMVAAALVSTFGWRTAFVVLGVTGFVWLAAWQVWYRVPEEARWLPVAERAKILGERNGRGGESVGQYPPPSSIGYLLSQRRIWGLVITQACLVYTAYMFLTWLPSYLQSTRELSTMNTGYLTAIPYLFTIILGLIIARTSDRMLSSGDIQAARWRNFIAAMAVLALLILLAPVVGSLWQLLVVLTLVLTGSTTGAGLKLHAGE